MKTLFTYINHEFITEEFNKIDSEIICESLNCKVLKEVAKQLLDANKKDQQNIDDEKKKYADAGRKYWGNETSKIPKFAAVFANPYSGEAIRWDKVTDDDITEVDASTWDTMSGKNSADIRKVINLKKQEMLFIKDPNTNQYKYVIFNGGKLVRLSSDNAYNIGKTWDGLNQKQKIDLCKNCTLYFINIAGKTEEFAKFRADRFNQKYGMINLDPESLNQLAKDNRDRYKKLVTKMKAMNINNDTLIDKCNDLIQKISELTATVAKDPISNADMIYPLSTLTTYIYDKERWESKGRSGHTVGSNGLLPLLMNYINSAKYASRDGYEYSLDSLKSHKRNIEIKIDQIEKYAKKNNIAL